jgi:uncharacterized membrane protein YfcA
MGGTLSLPIFYFIIAGIIGGVILASTGIIGPFLVPVLLMLGLSSNIARGTALVSELFMTLIYTMGHAKERNIDKRVTSALLPGAITVVLGANVSIQVPELSMDFAIGILETIIGIILIYTSVKGTKEQGAKTSTVAKIPIGKFVIVAVFAGFAKGFFGIGWGPMVIGLLVLLGVKPRIAVGSSLVIRLLLDCLGGISYASMNLVDINVVVVLSLAGALTAFPAIKLATIASEKTFRIILGGVITLLGAFVIIKALIFIP